MNLDPGRIPRDILILDTGKEQDISKICQRSIRCKFINKSLFDIICIFITQLFQADTWVHWLY